MDKEKLEALARAIQLEIDGRKFYLEAARKSGNDVGKRMFQYLADQELEHQTRIKGVYERLEKGEEWPVGIVSFPHADAKTVFGSEARAKMSGAEGDKEAVELALGLEDKSYDYYNELTRKAQGLFEKRFFAALSLEERGHYLMLLDALEYLTDPSGWAQRHEHTLLEG